MQEIRKIAVLIDGDNAESKLMEQILGEVGKYGKITIKKVYGDFSIPQISKNKDGAPIGYVNPDGSPMVSMLSLPEGEPTERAELVAFFAVRVQKTILGETFTDAGETVL
jgi:hypothetical protein